MVAFCLCVFACLASGERTEAEIDSRRPALELPLPVHTFPSSEEADHWQKVILSPEWLRDRLTATESQNSRNFLASINALTTLALYATPPLLLRLPGKAGQSRKPEPSATIGSWELVPQSPETMTTIAPLPAREKWEDAVAHLFLTNPAAAAADVHKLWEFLAREVLGKLEPGRRSVAIASAINAWEQTGDPHARFLPIAYLQQLYSSGGTGNEFAFTAKLEQLKPQIFPSVAMSSVHAGYVKLRSLHGMAGALTTAIKTLEANGAHAIILDLRGNGGGPVEDAEMILNIFLDAANARRLFFVRPSRENFEQKHFYAKRQADTQKPLIVLVDATTKSVAELIAGVLQHYRRAWVVGDTTFGKGVYVAPTAKYGTDAILFESTLVLHYPDGGSPQLVGVTPDFFVERNPEAMRVPNTYTNPLPREAPHFVQPPERAAAIIRLTACMDRYESSVPADPTLARSLLLLHCLNLKK